MKEFDRELFIDIETYSSVDIKECGAYKYIASPDFEILICGYAFGDDDVVMVDLASGDKWPSEFLKALKDPKCLKIAHNAVFERTAFNGIGLHTETDEWYCPQCGCRDQKKVIPTRRTCGYLGSHHWNQGKTEEITSRVLHVD